ncbi:BSD domain-containing protein 1-like [Branchiostoma floridae]|uniref:BSD domain-containing protein 1-like n=1 Tax=Branchiostoma floridae TaxID=7739 RepID=A0A9J7KD53_BRAFL|nr:BSD domain-containing protein 1-like [Branchiostoma floridae]
MAEGGGDTWFGGWVKAAKDKSGEVFDFMKRDLTEFSTVVQKDTATAVASTATTVKSKLHEHQISQPSELAEQSATGGTLKEGLSNFLGAISRSLAVDDDDVEEIRIGPASPTAVYGRAQARLHNMQIDPGTYCNEPDGPQDQYFKWLETFDLEGIKGDISDLLVAKNEVRALYTRLVPSAVSHSEFWQRYFYKLHQLQQDEARRAALMERADNTSPSDDLGWEDDEDEWGWETPDASTLPAISEGAIATQPGPKEEPKEESAPREAELVLPEEERSPSAVSSEESSELVMLEKPSSEASVSSDETLATAAPKRSSPTSSDSSDVVLVDRPSIEDTRETASTKTGVQVQETSPADEKSEKPSVVPVPPVTQESVEKGEDVEDKIAERTEPKPQQSLDTEGSVPEQVVEEKTEETIVDSLAKQVEAQVRIPSDKIEEKAPESEPQVPAAASKKEDVKEVGEPLLLAGAKEGEIDRASPASAGGSSGAKDSSESLSDDWEKDFDLDLTEEEMRIAQAALEKDGKDTGDLDDDWESWE